MKGALAHFHLVANGHIGDNFSAWLFCFFPSGFLM